MRIFRRREALDAEVRARLEADTNERPLAWAHGEDAWLVGTERALHWVGEASRRIPWEQIERADWDGESDRLTVVEVADWGQPEPRQEIVLQGTPDRLLQLLRERVTRSIVVQQFVPVRGRAGLTVVGRRSPAEDGPLAWAYVIGRGLDPDDPEVRRRADEARAVAEREIGAD